MFDVERRNILSQVVANHIPELTHSHSWITLYEHNNLWGRTIKILIIIIAVILPYHASAESLTVTVWNIAGAHFTNRSDQYKQFKAEINPDIIILSELLSHKMNRKFLKQAGFADWQYVTSDFSKDSQKNKYYKLEVGVASKYDISNMVEYDPRPGDDSDKGDKPITIPSYIPEGQRKIKPYRGFIITEIAEKKLAIVAVHLKSSVGKSGRRDEKNSKKREVIIGAAMEAVAAHKGSHAGWSYIVAGDFNVAPGDKVKNSNDFNVVCSSDDCTGYDQTHAIASGAYTEGVTMVNVTAAIGRTYVGTRFVNSPIDNIYVMGPLFMREYTLKKSGPYGSDHYAVSVTFD